MVKDHRKKGIERKVFTIKNFERTEKSVEQNDRFIVSYTRFFELWISVFMGTTFLNHDEGSKMA